MPNARYAKDKFGLVRWEMARSGEDLAARFVEALDHASLALFVNDTTISPDLNRQIREFGSRISGEKGFRATILALSTEQVENVVKEFLELADALDREVS